ncbi:signal transduction histidine kinase [Haloactinopolyspora alba]|uniref:Oxygen sensor histidine kinase NreB n=1 Tax=Haloactinopolyspora alba TaxID=648780 RepID=A0A2P8EB79_9ACTN|nr:sensor histidine kinase [Haloactinopolyspora alba]PSL06721.1 signal transduction histidine kinase [Haloactinopolyspora alba]
MGPEGGQLSAADPGPASAPAKGSSEADLMAFWSRMAVGWHTLYVGLVVLVAVLTGTSDDVAGGERTAALLVLALMILSYLLLGRRRLGDADSTPAAIALVAISWGCLYALLALGSQSAYILLFGLFPHVWALLRTRHAVVATFVLVTGMAVVEFTQLGWSSDRFGDALPEYATQVGLSLLLGLFITGVFDQAEKRAALIDELERTRAELAETEHSRGALAERERLAHEIHDTLAQGFTSVLTLAQAVEVALERDPAAARERLALLESTARDNLAEARALVGALAPVGLQDASLPEAVQRAATRFGHETGVDVDVRVEGDPVVLPAGTEVVLLRTVQEALANVRRHAGASRVCLALRFRPGVPDGATVAVVDDGSGFRTDDGHGFGLHGMRTRVTQAGGTLDIVSAPGSGTTVRVTMPGRADPDLDHRG